MIQDIRIDVRWRSHPKRAKLALLLGHDGTGYVLDLWISAAQSKPDGILRGLDALDISIMAGWPGKPDDFVAALAATRLLDEHPEGCWALHDWAEHQPWVIGAPERVAKAKKAASVRWEDREKDAKGPGRAVPGLQEMPEAGPKNGQKMLRVCSEYAPSIPQAMPESQSSNAPLLSSPSPKGIKTPPERDKSLSAPVGGKGIHGEKKPKFLRPSVEEIKAYCDERGNGIDAEAFWSFYESKGWVVGKSPMKSWKAAMVTWEKTRKGESKAPAAKVQSPAERLLAKTSGGTRQ